MVEEKVVKKECKSSKNMTKKKNFYLPILNLLNETTNLTKIQNTLGISKQNLNYYLRQLKRKGIIINSSSGSWEVLKDSKNMTKYGELLSKDTIRGHAYVIDLKLPKEIKGWDDRIEILKKKDIHFKLVGALKDIPRIKALGRKVWLCKDKIKIFDTPESSYYGVNAIESRKLAFYEFKKIINVISNKLGIKLNPIDLDWRKEHLAFIKNDLAIEENRRGNIIRISDEFGEWLIVDDSMEKGGELENIGKKSLVTNIHMQKWWNENKETNFGVGAKFTLEGFGKVQDALQKLTDNMLILTNQVGILKEENTRLKNQLNVKNPLDNQLDKFKDSDLDNFKGNYIG